MSESKQSNSLLTVEECLKNFRLTRDFDLYLDMLNRLKSKYLIILCLKTATGQSISGKTAEKIRSLGFSNFTAEHEMTYAGVLHNGDAICNSSSKTFETPRSYDGTVPKGKIYISFMDKETEIKINGKEQSLNDKGINIVVYDLKSSKAEDVSVYNTADGKPTFYHRNFYYTEKYIDTHIYMPESFKDEVTLPLRRSYFSPRSLSVREVERGIFLPSKRIRELDEYGKEAYTFRTLGGICDESFRFVAGHQIHYTRGEFGDDRHITDSYNVPPEDISYTDETVLYGGTLIEHPGHLITECFADRLWWLAENPNSDIKIAIEIIWSTHDWTTGNISFVKEFFEAFGISEDRLIVIKQPVQFKKIIVPDQSSMPLNYCFPYDFTSEYIKPFQHIKEQLTPGKYKKIYLTKSKLHNKSIVGEEYFIDFFEKKGFAVINPEDYSIKEKAELMYGADEVVTIDGTNSLFTVFCRPTVKLTILTKRMDYWDTPQQLITQALGIKEFYLVNISGNFLESFSDNAFVNFSRGLVFTYASKEFRKYVKYIYNEELDITPEESLKKYFYDYLTYFPKYYSDKRYFRIVRNIKMANILRSMSEVFSGKGLDTSDILFISDDEFKIKELEHLLQEEKETSAKKINYLTEKAKESINENASLKQTLAQYEAENLRLRKENSELSAYMAEISQLLDALEAGGGMPTEE